LTEEYFYFDKRWSRFHRTCKTCRSRKSVNRQRERYWSDPKWRNKVLSKNRRLAVQRRQREKAERFARVLGVAS
jgi:hypothetical protein